MARVRRHGRLRCDWCGRPDSASSPVVTLADAWCCGGCYDEAVGLLLEDLHHRAGDAPAAPEPIAGQDRERPAAPPVAAPPEPDPLAGFRAVGRMLAREETLRRRRLIEAAAGV